MSRSTENIFPISPKQEGGLFVVTHGYEGIVVTDSTSEVARNTAIDYFTRRTPEELAELGLHPSLVQQPTFIAGVLQLTRFLAGRDTDRTYFEAFDSNPHFSQDEVADLERGFAL